MLIADAILMVLLDNLFATLEIFQMALRKVKNALGQGCPKSVWHIASLMEDMSRKD